MDSVFDGLTEEKWQEMLENHKRNQIERSKYTDAQWFELIGRHSGVAYDQDSIDTLQDFKRQTTTIVGPNKSDKWSVVV